MNFRTTLLSGALVLGAPTSLLAGSYSIVQTVSQTVGSTASIPSSGSKSNTAVWQEGTAGRFIMMDSAGNLIGMQVDATNPTGVLKTGQDSLMVARTVNSQGLTDTGTLSIYVNPGNTVVNGNWTLDIKFSFFDVTFTTPLAVQVLLTSLDIDYSQKYYTQTADFQSNNLYGNSNLTSATAISGYTGFTAGGNSLFSDPRHAVSSKSNLTTNFDVKLANNKLALYMFEFRDPSAIVPEPGTTAVLALGALGLLLRRRRDG